MTSSAPQIWYASDAARGADGRQFAPATLRNRAAILAVLRDELPPSGQVLEIASGSGEHAVFFSGQLPDIIWQPSDQDTSSLTSIAAWAGSLHPRLANLRAPLHLDLLQGEWPVAAADAIFVANLTHIAPWAATERLFVGGAKSLDGASPIIIYGPFFRAGHKAGEGDAAFDLALRARDEASGLRWVEDIDDAAVRHGFHQTAAHSMPADNLTLVYRRMPKA